MWDISCYLHLHFRISASLILSFFCLLCIYLKNLCFLSNFGYVISVLSCLDMSNSLQLVCFRDCARDLDAFKKVFVLVYASYENVKVD